MIFTPSDYRWLAVRLWKTALVLYAISLASRTVLMSAVYMPELEHVSRTLAQLLRFFVTELQAFTSPVLVTLLGVTVLICHPILSSRLKDDGDAHQ